MLSGLNHLGVNMQFTVLSSEIQGVMCEVI